MAKYSKRDRKNVETDTQYSISIRLTQMANDKIQQIRIPYYDESVVEVFLIKKKGEEERHNYHG